MNTKTLNNNTVASHPGGISLSHRKLEILQPEIYSYAKRMKFLFWSGYKLPPFFDSSPSYWKTYVADHLEYGDSRAALVISANPLLIAAYTDEMDCIAMLSFDSKFADEYELKVNSRMLTVNTYWRGLRLSKDLSQGARATGRYNNFAPFIAEFFTDDLDQVERRKIEICESEWQRTVCLATEYISKHGLKARDGRPWLCQLAAK